MATTATRLSRSNPHPAQQEASPAVRFEGLTVRYGSAIALREVTLGVPRGAILAVLGPSGAGKSTLLRTVNRLTDLVAGCRVEGSVRVTGRDVAAADPARLRLQAGMVFQQPNPFPVSIWKNLEIPLRDHGVRDRAEIASRIERSLDAVGLLREVQDRVKESALSLSGGQQQRLCLARALVLEPEILLLDEPTGSLDPLATALVEERIRRLSQYLTVILVAHELRRARRLAPASLPTTPAQVRRSAPASTRPVRPVGSLAPARARVSPSSLSPSPPTTTTSSPARASRRASSANRSTGQRFEGP